MKPLSIMNDVEKHYFHVGFERGRAIAAQAVCRVYENNGESFVELFDQAEPMSYQNAIGEIHEMEETDRQFSPFEFLAKEMNSYGEQDGDVWDSFDGGLVEGILYEVELIGSKE